MSIKKNVAAVAVTLMSTVALAGPAVADGGFGGPTDVAGGGLAQPEEYRYAPQGSSVRSSGETDSYAAVQPAPEQPGQGGNERVVYIDGKGETDQASGYPEDAFKPLVVPMNQSANAADADSAIVRLRVRPGETDRAAGLEVVFFEARRDVFDNLAFLRPSPPAGGSIG